MLRSRLFAAIAVLVLAAPLAGCGGSGGDGGASTSPVFENLLVNPGFDAGPGPPWQEFSSASYSLIESAGHLVVTVQTGSYAVWLGGANSLESRLWQSVSVPSGATALRVTGYYWIASAETGTSATDTLSIELRRTSDNAVIETVRSLSNLDKTTSWTPFSVTVAAHAGENVDLVFHSFTDAAFNTNFFVDTLTLDAVVYK